MKKIFLLFFVVFSFYSKAQVYAPIADTTGLRDKINLWIVPNSTQAISAAKLNNILQGYLNAIKQYNYDSIWVRNDTLFCKKNNNTKFYIFNGSGSNNLMFSQNVVVNGETGTTLGVWQNGDTIPLAGKPYDSLPYILATKCNHPPYNGPTISISASPAFGTYEYGTNLGTITLSRTFNQNDAGAATTTTYYQNSSPLGGNTTTISSLTSNQTFYSNVAYGTGVVKNDNCGNADATGQITAGSVNSGTNGYYTGFKYYIGACSGTNPTNAEIRAAAQQTFGSSRSQSNINIAVSGTQYVFYAYPASWGDLTRVWNSLGDFTINSSGWLKVANTSFTNAQGATVALNVYTLQAPQSGNVNGLNFQ